MNTDSGQTAEAGVAASGSFIDTLPEDLRSDTSLKDIKDVGALAKSYVNAQRMIGNSVRIPSADAPKEQIEAFYKQVTNVPGIMVAPDETNEQSMDEFYNRMGRPASSNEYKINLPEGVEINNEILAEFTGLAHKLGLNNKQVEAIAHFELQKEQAMHEMSEQSRARAEEALKKNWGAEFDVRMNTAKEVVRIYSEKFPDAMQEVVNGPAGNNPAVIAMLAELGRHLSEKGVINPETSKRFGMSSDEAMEILSDIKNNPSHPYRNPTHPEHKAAKEKVDKLYRIAYPD